MIPITHFLADMFADVISAREILTRNTFGTPLTYGASVSLPAHITGQHTTVKDREGKERKSTVKAIINGVYGLTIDFEYTLPSRFKPNVPDPISVGDWSDENGAHHEVVYF